MKLKQFYLPLALILMNTIQGLTSSHTFESKIFSFEEISSNDPSKRQYLHTELTGVTFKGEKWSANDVKCEDLEFHQNLYMNRDVMIHFANGDSLSKGGVTEATIITSIDDGFSKGHPHGFMTVRNTDFPDVPMMSIVAGGGSCPGFSEIAYAISPEFHNKGVGTSVVRSVVEVWAPEVSRIGLGLVTDQQSIIDKFKCFQGEALKKLEATASPANIASWKILDKLEFNAAKLNLNTDQPTIDMDLREFDKRQDLENELLNLFDVNKCNPYGLDQPLKADTRYRLFGPDNKMRTFSKKSEWNNIKYHFEKDAI